MVDNHEDPPPLYPSAASAKDCPPDAERGGLRFDARQHNAECWFGAQRAFEPATRDAVAARGCGESVRVAEKMRAAHSSDDDSDAKGHETDMIDDALDDDDGDEHGDESLATFSSAKTIYESADVVRVAAFPSPPFVEREDPTKVDWEAAMPIHWPADLNDLFANNPAGARTWSDVEAAMHQLVAYHTVRDMSRILSVIVRRASACTRERTQRTLPAVRRRCCRLLLLQNKLG